MKLSRPPPVTTGNLQRRVWFSTRNLQRFAGVACNLVWHCRRPRSEIASLDHIDVLIVSDRRMAVLHKKFCGVPGTTDVLSFQHGEIVISADTAARQARRFQTDVIAEIQLYLLHGLLHLAGFDDTTVSKRRQMDRVQKKLIKIISGTNDSRQ